MPDQGQTQTDPMPAYSPLVAGKYAGWGGGIVAAAYTAVPRVTAALTAFGTPIQPGSPADTLLIKYHLLPVLVAAALFVAHDFARLKTKYPWL